VFLTVLLTDVEKDVIDAVFLDVALQDADEGLATLPIDYHHADHCVNDLAQEFAADYGLVFRLAQGFHLLFEVADEALMDGWQEVLHAGTVFGQTDN
jgi:hypothetical protein